MTKVMNYEPRKDLGMKYVTVQLSPDLVVEELMRFQTGQGYSQGYLLLKADSNSFKDLPFGHYPGCDENRRIVLEKTKEVIPNDIVHLEFIGDNLFPCSNPHEKGRYQALLKIVRSKQSYLAIIEIGKEPMCDGEMKAFIVPSKDEQIKNDQIKFLENLAEEL